MLPIALSLVVTGIAIAYGLEVLGSLRDDQCDYNNNAGNCFQCNDTSMTDFNTSDNTCYNASQDVPAKVNQNAEFNATSDTIVGVSKLPEKLPIIVTVIVAAIVIGILVRYLWVSVG